MIELKNVSKTYVMGDQTVHALRDVSLKIGVGEFIAIMGPSGSGKSTLMHILGLLDVPDKGVYTLFGKDIARYSEEDLASVRARTLGFVFQQFNLLARTSAFENVCLPLLYSGNGKDRAWAKKMLDKVGLASRANHKPNELSGGQQQRVAIARALANHPAVVLADEPTGNLDSQTEKEIMRILTEMHESGITVILVTHEEEIAQYALRVIRMRDGRIQSDESREKPKAVTLAPPAETKRPPLWRTLDDHLKVAVRSLAANKVRTGLSMLGILIGVGAVIAMLALGSGARRSIESRLASMGSNLLTLRPGARQSGGVALESGSVTRLTLADARAIQEELPAVSKVAPSVRSRAQMTYGNKNWNTQVLGTTPNYAPMRASVPTVGRFFTDEEDRGRARVVVLGLTPARELFGEANPLGEFIKINKINFQVIGLLPEKGATGWRDEDDTAAIPVTTAMRRLMGRDYVESIDIEVADASLIEATQDDVVALMKSRRSSSRNEEFDIRNMAEIQAALSETSRTMSWLLTSIAAVSLLVGGIGIMNIMLVSVTERTREIGLRKAVGARPADILLQFLSESVVVSVLGGLIGVLLGTGASLAMSKLAGWTASVSLGSVVLAFGFSAAVGVVFGFWPARKAAALNPIVALRYE